MLLIEATNIKQGGGKVLLDYLESELTLRGIQYEILRSQQYDSLSKSKQSISINFGSFFSRNSFLKAQIKRTNPNILFCFGNFPPGFKDRNRKYRTYTYFHNALFLDNAEVFRFSFKNQLIFRLKKLFLSGVVNNSDEYIVQTNTIKRGFASTFHFPLEQIRVLPFFDIDKIITIKKNIEASTPKKKNAFIYPSSPHSHKNHERLLDAWKILHDKNLHPVLFLTIPNRPDTQSLLKQIENMQKEGQAVYNLGSLPFEDLMHEVAKSEYMIYPSFEETIGLSLVEGAIMDCKLIVSEKPYYKDVVTPSATFDPESANDIASKVELAMQQGLPPATLIINNEVDALIKMLTSVH